jgi:hypothetical protein
MLRRGRMRRQRRPRTADFERNCSGHWRTAPAAIGGEFEGLHSLGFLPQGALSAPAKCRARNGEVYLRGVNPSMSRRNSSRFAVGRKLKIEPMVAGRIEASPHIALMVSVSGWPALRRASAASGIGVAVLVIWTPEPTTQ